jgi:Carboxypeptidase regulatory-like domain
MARTTKTSCLLAALLLAHLAFADPPKDKDTSAGRVLIGKVMDRQDNPLSGGVVYLTNTRTRAIKTYIVSGDGSYRFPALSPNIDYEVFAEYKGHRSDTKTVSQFDSRSQVYINLKIDTK